MIVIANIWQGYNATACIGNYFLTSSLPCVIAYKVYKELKRLIAIKNIGMSINHMLEAAKTVTTIRLRMPENGTYFTKTLFLTEKQLAIKPLPNLSGNDS